MSKRSWAQTLVAVVLALLAAGFLQVAGGWVYGDSPYVQYLKWVHHDIPRFTVPVRLVEGTPFSFPARIIRTYGHELNLLVYFSGKKERAVVEGLIGGPIGQPVNAGRPPGKLPTTVRVTVKDQDQRIVYDQTRSSDGRHASSASFVGRQFAFLPPLNEGHYTISVTPLSDVSGLAPFRTELELTYRSK
ncbi:hypothetical protein KMZ93_15660 [Bradyrhizobium sediminis]|uniref:DUF5625 domain-containing protein n=1 Tax=Bradyrhizobium sediminis TaxID=2840469 RepID=A0A975RV82_9BRAD|nr:hypothetical protein [Bradyrhizobium sediminis]QWG21450.1 hypothetical protein KMZ93_15660 [Bradyrhizobium sediminis]